MNLVGDLLGFALGGPNPPPRSLPIPDPELDGPWRPVTWRYLKDFQPDTAKVSEIVILLHGPVGAGKSSFINSINTALKGHNSSTALASDSSAAQSQSFSLKLKFHRLKKDGPGSFYPFVFTDIMGLQEGTSDGVQTEDIIQILKGRVKSSYTFNPVKPISEDDPHYMRNPGLKDKVHCLVCVLPADKISLISDIVIQKMRAVRKKASDLEIPQVVIMSRVDKVCPLVQKDLRKIYTSKKIKEKMLECSQKLGVPMNCVFPVQNYHEQITNDLNMDVLILMAVTDIIRFANDYTENQLGDLLWPGHKALNPALTTAQTLAPSLVPSPDPSPEPELDHPWRPVTWSENDKNQMLRYLKDFQPDTVEVKGIKILIYGPVGAGKSSFINSINTVLQGYMTSTALVADSSAGLNKSFTLKLKFHRLKKDGPGSFYPFVFTDIMGLQEGTSDGVQTEDIIQILKGRVKSSYTFNPVKPISEDDPHYMRNPGLKDRVHCLVSVLPADKISLISDNIIQKMRAVREKARDLEIPQVIIMSRVDKVCPLVQKGLRKIYTSKKIKEKMLECSQKLGVPMNFIFPVQNYHEQITNDLNMDVLILMAVTRIIRFANNYVEEQVYEE